MPDPHAPAGTGLLRPVLPALAFVVGALLLTRFITSDPEQAEAMARGIAGPTTWPRFMLYGVVLFALGWLVQGLRKTLRHRADGKPLVRPELVGRSDLRVWIGILLILAYGATIPVLGFAFATLLYLVLWLVLGGILQPLKVALTAVLGTTVFLYVFVKLALMPLDRGAGAIGEATVSLYRLMGIY